MADLWVLTVRPAGAVDGNCVCVRLADARRSAGRSVRAILFGVDAAPARAGPADGADIPGAGFTSASIHRRLWGVLIA